MTEKVFELMDKTKVIVRTVENLRKGYKFQQGIGNILKEDTRSDITSEDYDPAAYFETQEKILDYRINFLSPIFGLTKKALEQADPLEIVEVSEGMYRFFTANDIEDEEEESGEA